MRPILLIPVALLGICCAAAFASVEQADSSAAGRITSLKAKSITVRHGDRHLSCSLTSYSPATAMFALGEKVKIACTRHVLVAISDVPAKESARNYDDETTTTSNVTNANGPISGLNSSTITVQTMTCTIGANSPSTAGFALGDSVRMYCLNGVLYQLKHNDSPPPAPLTTTTTATTTTHSDSPPPTTSTTTTTTPTTPQNYSGITGNITTLSDGSITVTSSGTNDPTSLTCTLGAGTPSTSGFGVGSNVRMYCLNGVLYQLKDNTTPLPTTSTTTTTTTTTTTMTQTTPQNVTDANGTLSTLSVDRITVGDLSCTIDGTSPSTSGFSIGNSVRMYCINGVLYQLRHNT